MILTIRNFIRERIRKAKTTTVNRSSHLIFDPVSNKYRILAPVECERLDEFPDNLTNTGMPEKRRYFMMGNALVCGLIKTIGKKIKRIVEEEE